MNKQVLYVLLLLLLFQGISYAQDGLIEDDFFAGSNNWITSTTGATYEIVNGQMVVTMALQSSGKYRGDFRRNDGATFHAGNYPIVAVKFNKPPRSNCFFDTNLGSYDNRNNNHTVIPTTTGNIYYWDLSAGSLGTTTLPLDQPTTVSLFQIKVADVVLTQAELDANDISYEIDWIKTFASVDELRAAANLPAPTHPYFEFTGTFSHPGLLHSQSDLNRIKDLVDRQVKRPYESYQLLTANGRSSSSYQMRGPYQYLTRDNSLTVNGVPGGTVKNHVENDFLAAYYNAIMWNITGNEANALKSIEIIDAYAATTEAIIGGDAELNGLYGFMLANAAELMRYTYSNWPAASIQQCQTMLQSVFYPIIGNFRPCGHGNWDIICMKALMAIAIFSDDVPMFNKAVNYFYNGEGNGSIDNYVLTAAGQLQESNRDQPHTMLALGCLAELSEMALKQGVDLYETSNNAIMRGYEYTANYNLGNAVPYETSYDFCERNYQDYTPESISANGRGQFRAVFEIAYNHYAYRRGYELPYTLDVLELGAEGQSAGADNPGYGSLLFYLNTEEDHPYDTTDNVVDPSVGLIDDNFTTGADGWIAATSGSTASVVDGQLVVSLAMQSSGKSRGDIKKSSGAVLFPPNYPILAIKMKKPVAGNVIFDTNMGSYGNGANKWTGKIGEDIYYYDLTQTGFGSGNTPLSGTAPTNLTTFQFKVADITSGEENYSVDWVKTVKSVNDLLALEPTTGLIDDDFTDGNDGWAAVTSGSTATVEDGQLKVMLALQSNGKYRGDIRKTGGATLFAGNYSIVAIKFKKPAVSNIIFDTNLGSYKNGSNKWTGKVGEDIYYYDLTEGGFGSSGTMLTDPTALTTFQFKVADITSGEESYLVDWVKTVKSVDDLLAFDPATGLIDDNFEEGNDGWAAATSGSTAAVEEGQLKVILALQFNGKYRGDIKKTGGATLFAGNYPIVAIKIDKPEVANIIFDTNIGSYKNGANKWTGIVGRDVYYYDLTAGGFGSAGSMVTDPTVLTLLQFKVADITSGEESYTIDWVKTFHSLEELKSQVPHVPQNITFSSLSDKIIGDPDFALEATASSGLPVYFASSDTSVVKITDNNVQIIGAGTAEVTAFQDGDSLYMSADPVAQTLTIRPLDFTVLHKDGDSGRISNNNIKPYLEVVNNDSIDIPYSELTVRYWFTPENYAGIDTWIDYAQLGGDLVAAKYIVLEDPHSGAFGFVEYSFDSLAGMSTAGSNSGPIQSRLSNTDWTNFDESDDHSYQSNLPYTANEHITLYRNGYLIWGTEPAQAVPELSLKIYSENKNANTGTNSIKTHLNLANEGNVPVAYEDLSIRYWFTKDSDADLNYWIDYADLGEQNVSGEFVSVDPVIGADTYFEIAIDSSVGTLYPLSNTEEIQYRIAKTDWSGFNEADDHSYMPKAPFAENNHITVYHKGELVYGTEPGAGNLRTGVDELRSNNKDQILFSEFTAYPNPVSDKLTILLNSQNTEDVQITLHNSIGKLLLTKTISGSRHELDLGTVSPGVYIVTVTSPGTSVFRKIVKE